jgi:hypothetical protein
MPPPRWGTNPSRSVSIALLTFAALLLPFALASHATHALEVLRLPLREVREVRPNRGQAASPGGS